MNKILFLSLALFVEKTGGLKVRALLFTRVVRLFFRQDE